MGLISKGFGALAVVSAGAQAGITEDLQAIYAYARTNGSLNSDKTYSLTVGDYKVKSSAGNTWVERDVGNKVYYFYDLGNNGLDRAVFAESKDRKPFPSPLFFDDLKKSKMMLDSLLTASKPTKPSTRTTRRIYMVHPNSTLCYNFKKGTKEKLTPKKREGLKQFYESEIKRIRQLLLKRSKN